MKQIIYQGKYITTSEEEINGHIYERTELIPNVHVLPIRDNKILLMNEFRTHEKSSRWKLVTGWAEKKGKTLLEHAQEELAEEVGMQAKSWKEFFDASVPHATVNLNTHYFVCTDISELAEKIDNPDVGCIVNKYDWFTFGQIFELINNGKMFPDESSMIALWYLYSHNKKQS